MQNGSHHDISLFSGTLSKQEKGQGYHVTSSLQ